MGAARGRPGRGGGHRCATTGPASPTAGSRRPPREGRLGVASVDPRPDRRPRRHRGAAHRRRGTEWELGPRRLEDDTMTMPGDHPRRPPVRSTRARRDPVRRLRGRIGGAGHALDAPATEDGRAGLTVSSLWWRAASRRRLLALLDPDSDLAEVLSATGRGVVHLLALGAPRPRRGVRRAAPAPGRAVPDGRTFEPTPAAGRGWCPRPPGPASSSRAPRRSAGRAGDRRDRGREVGDDDDPLVHRRGRYAPPGPDARSLGSPPA